MKKLNKRLRLANTIALILASQSALATMDAVKYEGDILLGFDNYDAFYGIEDQEDRNGESYLRRFKVGAKYQLDNHWRFRLSVSASKKNDDEKVESEIDDFSFRYRNNAFGTIQIGKMKEPFGFERLASVNDNLSLERSVISTAFAPGRSQGLLIQNLGKNYGWSAGLFESKGRYQNARAVTARSYFLPYESDSERVHLGLATSYRNHGGNVFQVRESGEVYSARNILRSAQFYADSSFIVGLEFLWQRGALLLSSEYMQQQVRQNIGITWNYSGYYFQCSYLINGSRRYKKGELKSVKPESDFGAYELIARHSELDIRDNGLGSNSKISSFGLNYIYSRSLQAKLVYIMPAITGNTLVAEAEGDAFSLGLQYQF